MPASFARVPPPGLADEMPSKLRGVASRRAESGKSGVAPARPSRDHLHLESRANRRAPPPARASKGARRMSDVVEIQDIEQMRQQEGIDDVELRGEVRQLRAGDYVRLTFLAGPRQC